MKWEKKYATRNSSRNHFMTDTFLREWEKLNQNGTEKDDQECINGNSKPLRWTTSNWNQTPNWFLRKICKSGVRFGLNLKKNYTEQSFLKPHSIQSNLKHISDYTEFVTVLTFHNERNVVNGNAQFQVLGCRVRTGKVFVNWPESFLILISRVRKI